MVSFFIKEIESLTFISDELWLALNVEEGIPRTEIQQSYTHLAFSIKETELEAAYKKLLKHNCLLEGRKSHAGNMNSLYFQDPDVHKFEFHTGTLENRLKLLGQVKVDFCCCVGKVNLNVIR